MSILPKIKRLSDSLKQEENPDLILTTKAVIVGMTNFYFKNKKSKDLAQYRFENFCLNCEYNVEDPVEEMQVNDSEIPAMTNRMCGHCGGCTLSYKTRQNIKPCFKWK